MARVTITGLSRRTIERYGGWHVVTPTSTRRRIAGAPEPDADTAAAADDTAGPSGRESDQGADPGATDTRDEGG